MKRLFAALSFIILFIAGCSEENYELIDAYRVETVREKGVFTTKKQTKELVEFIYQDKDSYEKATNLREQVDISDKNRVTHSFWSSLRLHLTPEEYDKIFGEEPEK